jgi:adenylyltransferase/sulfurtransferase
MPTCDTAGVLGPAVSIVAGFQAAEAIKILLGATDAVSRALLTFDVWTNELRRVDLSGARASDCACCVKRSFTHLDGAGGAMTASLCGRDTVQVLPMTPGRIDLTELARRLAPHGAFRATPFLLKGPLSEERGDEGGPVQLAVFTNGRALISGVSRPERARSIYAKYVGG